MITVIKRYLQIFKISLVASAISELEYRFNVSARFFTDIIWYAAQLSIFEVLYNLTNDINGWSHSATRAFMGVLFVVDSLYMLLFSENLDKLSQKVQRGEIDLILVKPVNSQFMLSLQKISVAYFGNFLISLMWLTYALGQVGNVSGYLILTLLLTVPCGVAVGYGIRFTIGSFSLVFTKSESLTYIWYQLYRLATRPDTFYPAIMRYSILTVLPVGFIASVPAQIVLGRAPLVYAGWSLLMATVTIWLSTKTWNWGLKNYVSSSS